MAAEGKVHKREDQIARNAIRKSLLKKARGIMEVISSYFAAGDQPSGNLRNKKDDIESFFQDIGIYSKIANEVQYLI